METKLIHKWWFWICTTLMLLVTLSFIVSMTYALHPFKIYFYANDEMVATTETMFQIQRDIQYNDCIKICTEMNIEESYACWDSCYAYYDNKEYTGGITDCKFLSEQNNRCMEKYFEVVNKNR